MSRAAQLALDLQLGAALSPGKRARAWVRQVKAAKLPRRARCKCGAPVPAGALLPLCASCLFRETTRLRRARRAELGDWLEADHNIRGAAREIRRKRAAKKSPDTIEGWQQLIRAERAKNRKG